MNAGRVEAAVDVEEAAGLDRYWQNYASTRRFIWKKRNRGWGRLEAG